MRIGIDIGGTKIEGIMLDNAGMTLFRDRIATPAGDYDATIDAVVSLIDRIGRETGRTGSVGIGIPGAISPSTGLVKNANSTCLIGKALDTDLERKLGRPVRLANDADCFTLSEATDGAASDYRSVFGVILGTGVGGGMVINGALIGGPNAIAGEWGHNRLPVVNDGGGPACYCGSTGCIETYLSGAGLSEDHFSATGNRLDARHIAWVANHGDDAAEATLKRYETRLAMALSIVINILDPEAIVLGGGLSNLGRLYENVPELLPAHVFSDAVETVLLPPLHGDSSGVRGAAWLWPVVE